MDRNGRIINKTALATLIVALFVAQPTVGAILPPPVDSTLYDVIAALQAAPTAPCPADAPLTSYNVIALPVPISYNHFGDLDLHGELFVPENDAPALLTDVGNKLVLAGAGDIGVSVLALRDAIVARNTAAAVNAANALRAATSAEATSRHLPPLARVEPTDLVQPVILRAHLGDCVQINLVNVLTQPVSFHVDSVISKAGQGEAVGLNAPDLTMPGAASVTRVWIPDWAGMEGAHFVHSMADPREQTRHGLFGAIMAEPRGSSWLSMKDAATPAPTGLDAIIAFPPSSLHSDFREYGLFYHDEVELVDWTLQTPLPQISPISGEYGPGTKALSLRTEPFYDRFAYQELLYNKGDVSRAYDKSQSYGSYTYGDPATHFQRSYLGDPVKFRLVNAGPGQPHIHHLHGGGIRWRTSPVADPTQFDAGFMKTGADIDPYTGLPSAPVNPVDESASQRVDIQNINPGETYNIEPEGGSGGTQQSVGDFLYHCHIAEHYLSGMWSFWRVYNTKQDDLAQLPDRAQGQVMRSDGLSFVVTDPVTSADLIGRTYQGITITADDQPSTATTQNISTWVANHVPARGVPGIDDASVWNWKMDGDVALGEPESPIAFPNWQGVGKIGDTPVKTGFRDIGDGERPIIGFDARTGRPAYPLLRPHFGERPPFAPDHGPAPYLGAEATPGHPDGLCPSSARHLSYNVVAIPASVAYNKFDTDPNAEVMVRAEDRARVQSDPSDPDHLNPTSILLRANAGDCVNVIFTQDLHEDEVSHSDLTKGLSRKTNIHIHLVQFDVQASDGVITGYNYETTVRPLTGGDSENTDFGVSAPVNTKVAGPLVVSTGTTVIPVARTSPFMDADPEGAQPKIGSRVGIGLGEPGTEEAHLLAVDTVAGTITVDKALQPHAVGQVVGYEFVNYGWFPDVNLGIVYFHDHVNGLLTWRHGLFGSLVVEPRGSLWLDPARVSDPGPQTAQQVQESPEAIAHVVDIITPDASKSFREITLHYQDRACVDPNGGECLSVAIPTPPTAATFEPAAFDLRAEPLWRRDAQSPFSSGVQYADPAGEPQGDPSTHLLRAYVGDKVEVRLLYAGQSDSRGASTFGVTGHRFQAEENLAGSRTVDAFSVAESSHQNWRLECGAGGCARQPGDYLYEMTTPTDLARGAWGLFRVLGADDASLHPLPAASNPDRAPAAYPPKAPDRYYDVEAVQETITNNARLGLSSSVSRFVIAGTPGDLTSAIAPPGPLVLRANAGDVIQVNLTNKIPGARVGLHAGLLSAPPSSQGVTVGNGPEQTVATGETISYVWYADADRDLGVADLVSLADPEHDAMRGLYGAIIIEPKDATFSPAVGPDATVVIDGVEAREHALLFHSEDGQFESSTMPYLPDVQARSLINYATEPLANEATADMPGAGRESPTTARFTGLDTCTVDDFCEGNLRQRVRNPLDPFATAIPMLSTPVIDAKKGQPLILRVVGSAGDQQIAFHLDGHVFATDADMDGCRTDLSVCKSNLQSTFTLGPRETRNVWIPQAGLGGAGDYMFRNHRDAFYEAGQWGLLRVG